MMGLRRPKPTEPSRLWAPPSRARGAAAIAKASARLRRAQREIRLGQGLIRGLPCTYCASAPDPCEVSQTELAQRGNAGLDQLVDFAEVDVGVGHAVGPAKAVLIQDLFEWHVD